MKYSAYMKDVIPQGANGILVIASLIMLPLINATSGLNHNHRHTYQFEWYGMTSLWIVGGFLAYQKESKLALLHFFSGVIPSLCFHLLLKPNYSGSLNHFTCSFIGIWGGIIAWKTSKILAIWVIPFILLGLIFGLSASF